MSYFPTLEEIAGLGLQAVPEEDCFRLSRTSLVSGRTGEVDLFNDEGHAVVAEWLFAGENSDLHGWITCEDYESLKHACETAFDVIAEGR